MKQKLYIVISILLIFGGLFYTWWTQSIKPANPSVTTPINITINRNESMRTIAEKLQNAGLVRSSVAFFILTRFRGFDNKIQAGEFRLNPSMDLYSILEALTHGTMDVWITVPEGLRREEIALKFAKDFNIPESEFIKISREGYLFPDTYLIPNDATVDDIIAIFNANLNKKLGEEIKQQVQNKNLSLDEIITIASLVEREAKFEGDRAIVARVILNRFKIGMKLDIDATIQYALGYQSKEKTWWKKDLTLENLAIDSPYNTYTNPGLPPTPISNPGLAAIRAVIDAPDADYLFYISDTSGKIHPANTIEEHNENIAKYLNR